MGGKLFKNFSFFSATLSFFILIGIFSILFTYAQDSIHEFGFHFLGSEVWEADEDDAELGVFGGYIPLLGTMLSTIIAMVIATPLAMGIAIFLTEIAHKSLIKPVSIAISFWLLFLVLSMVCGGFSILLQLFNPLLEVMV